MLLSVLCWICCIWYASMLFRGYDPRTPEHSEISQISQISSDLDRRSRANSTRLFALSALPPSRQYEAFCPLSHAPGPAVRCFLPSLPCPCYDACAMLQVLCRTCHAAEGMLPGLCRGGYAALKVVGAQRGSVLNFMWALKLVGADFA